jgi:hypothetical protein
MLYVGDGNALQHIEEGISMSDGSKLFKSFFIVILSSCQNGFRILIFTHYSIIYKIYNTIVADFEEAKTKMTI